MKSILFNFKLGKEKFEFKFSINSNASSWCVSINALTRGEVMRGFFEDQFISVGWSHPCVELFADQLRDIVAKEIIKFQNNHV